MKVKIHLIFIRSNPNQDTCAVGHLPQEHEAQSTSTQYRRSPIPYR